MIGSVKTRLLLMFFISFGSMLILVFNDIIFTENLTNLNRSGQEIQKLSINLLQMRNTEKEFYILKNEQSLVSFQKYVSEFKLALDKTESHLKEADLFLEELKEIKKKQAIYSILFEKYARNALKLDLKSEKLNGSGFLSNFEEVKRLINSLQTELIPIIDQKQALVKKINFGILAFMALAMIILVATSLKSLDVSFSSFQSFFKEGKTDNKPLDEKTVSFKEFKDMAAVANAMVRAQREVEKKLLDLNQYLEDRIKEDLQEINTLNDELEATQKELIFTLGATVESRSNDTAMHISRVAEYSRLLAAEYGFDKEEVDLLWQASPMHDVGKIAIPDHILDKIGKLTEDERRLMQKHTTIGYDILKHSERSLLKAAAIVAYEHHEKYDGTGYPRNLKGDNIHIYGRILAIADVFDALASTRTYKKAWEDEKIIAYFKEESGKHFDPKLVAIFLKNKAKFISIRKQYQDEDKEDSLSISQYISQSRLHSSL